MSDLDKINSKTQQVNKVEKCESLDEGTFAFLNWMNCKSFVGDNYELDPPLILRDIKLPKPTQVKLYDRYLRHGVIVDIIDSVPQCKNCRSDDCSHVGFAICLLQLIEREGLCSMDELTK
ncbi:hypothetical protein [Candidatus Nitrosocosmicus hydrocola]|jgi:hypothetical protein|uniref:hypothetical protein n=1 Tax=Candidatus Nitrosocosmicus hydrocola TaxID=1826872 RepID=UPI0011E5BA75|nr:hypothetical protein [Candidatus Nitrosocosmicus hydrocola]